MTLLFHVRRVGLFFLILFFNVNRLFSQEGFMSRDIYIDEGWNGGKSIIDNWWLILIIAGVILIVKSVRKERSWQRENDEADAVSAEGFFFRFMVLKGENDVYWICARGKSFEESFAKENLKTYKSYPATFKFIMYKRFHESEVMFNPELIKIGTLDYKRFDVMLDFAKNGYIFMTGNIYYDRVEREEAIKRGHEISEQLKVKWDVEDKIHWLSLEYLRNENKDEKP